VISLIIFPFKVIKKSNQTVIWCKILHCVFAKDICKLENFIQFYFPLCGDKTLCYFSLFISYLLSSKVVFLWMLSVWFIEFTSEIVTKLLLPVLLCYWCINLMYLNWPLDVWPLQVMYTRSDEPDKTGKLALE